MKKFWILPSLAVALMVAGCSSQPEETPARPVEPPTANAPASEAPTSEAPAGATAQPAKMTTEQELAKYCRVCVVDKGEKIEEYFPSRLDTKYGGQTYKLCSDDCKKKFDANPKRYALK